MNAELWREIRRLCGLGLSQRAVARQLGIHRKTVWRAMASEQLPVRTGRRRGSQADPFLKLLLARLQLYPDLTGRRLWAMTTEAGYAGSYSTLCRAVRHLRPALKPAYHTLQFAPGECAQVDWGAAGLIQVGSTRRRLSFFTLVLCHSRLLYAELTLGESLEHWLACHRHAFEFLGGVPARVMVDNCKVAVLQRRPGDEPQVNPRYADLAAHYDFTVTPCGVRRPQEKGRVESAVGYVKRDFLAGRGEVPFPALQAALRDWLDNRANVRVHGATGCQPRDRFRQTEQAALRPLPEHPYPCAVTDTVLATSQFRVVLDTNRYSVPSEYASSRLVLKRTADRLSLYHGAELVAEHPRCYDRHQDLLIPEHERELIVRTRHAREQRLLRDFLRLGPAAEPYLAQLRERRLDSRRHLARIVALIQHYGRDAVRRALEDALEMQAFSGEYILNILEARARVLPEPGPLHLTRRQDLLELSLPEPDLGLYEPGEPTDGPADSTR